MEQKDSKNVVEIQTSLHTLSDDGIVLEFAMSSETISVRVDVPDSNGDLKKVFNEISKLILTSDVVLRKLDVSEDLKSKMVAEVFEQYITDLNEEISSLRSEIVLQNDHE